MSAETFMVAAKEQRLAATLYPDGVVCVWLVHGRYPGRMLHTVLEKAKEHGLQYMPIMRGGDARGYGAYDANVPPSKPNKDGLWPDYRLMLTPVP